MIFAWLLFKPTTLWLCNHPIYILYIIPLIFRNILSHPWPLSEQRLQSYGCFCKKKLHFSMFCVKNNQNIFTRGQPSPFPHCALPQVIFLWSLTRIHAIALNKNGVQLFKPRMQWWQTWLWKCTKKHKAPRFHVWANNIVLIKHVFYAITKSAFYAITKGYMWFLW